MSVLGWVAPLLRHGKSAVKGRPRWTDLPRSLAGPLMTQVLTR